MPHSSPFVFCLYVLLSLYMLDIHSIPLLWCFCTLLLAFFFAYISPSLMVSFFNPRVRRSAISFRYLPFRFSTSSSVWFDGPSNTGRADKIPTWENNKKHRLRTILRLFLGPSVFPKTWQFSEQNSGRRNKRGVAESDAPMILL